MSFAEGLSLAGLMIAACIRTIPLSVLAAEKITRRERGRPCESCDVADSWSWRAGATRVHGRRDGTGSLAPRHKLPRVCVHV
jgi:hypothetical protein